MVEGTLALGRNLSDLLNLRKYLWNKNKSSIQWVGLGMESHAVMDIHQFADFKIDSNILVLYINNGHTYTYNAK